MKSIFIKTIQILVVTGTIIACSPGENKQETQSGKEYSSAYICPMHCEGSGSDTAGLCPVCGMDYVQKDKNQK